jgi:hypothetical protein
VKIIGSVKSDIAIGVSMTRVNITIAAGGRPMPRNPFISPAREKAPTITSVIPISWEGRSDVVMNSFTVALF